MPFYPCWYGRKAAEWLINMSEPINNPTPVPETAAPAVPSAAAPAAPSEKTYTQAEMDSILSKKLARAMKGMPGDEELTAFRSWKARQQTEQERWEAQTRELNESKTALAAAQAELEQSRREKFLLGKGVGADDVEFYAFKIGKLVTDTTDFEAAAAQYIKDHPPAGTMRVDFTAPLGIGRPVPSTNETMNSLIRGIRK